MCDALLYQGYSQEDIYLLSPESIPEVPLTTVLPSVNALEGAIKTWASESTQDLVLYLTGNGEDGIFHMSDTQTLSATQLDESLDILQDSLPGKVTIVYDASHSGSFLPFLTPPSDKERIIISSTSSIEQAQFSSQGDISFSKFFWNHVLNGSNVDKSFELAKRALSYGALGQTPHLDDTGNGISNEKQDGRLAKYYTIGIGIMLAGDEPVIGSISPPLDLNAGTTSGSIWVDNVTTTGTIDRVWAVITPPGRITGELINMTLDHVGDTRYEGTYPDFSTFGTYLVAVYAIDLDGKVSLPKETSVFQPVGPDAYEEGDTYVDASVIVIDNPEAQQHNFHDANDADWVKFYGIAGQTYTFEATNLGADCDVVIELYRYKDDTHDLEFVLKLDNGSSGEPEVSDWACNTPGIYYLMVYEFNNAYGEGMQYDLKIFHPVAAFTGFIEGIVKDALSDTPINKASIKSKYHSAVSRQDGSYLMIHVAAENIELTTQATGYDEQKYQDVDVPEGGIVNISFKLKPSDSDSDGVPDDGDFSGTVGDKPCVSGQTENCDDNCPEIFNPDQEDINNNGIGDACEDTDGDGLPNRWEEQYGLNPSLDDAHEDFDGDGYTNFQEYSSGSEPNSNASVPLEILEVIPCDNAGIDDDTRVPSNISFAVRVHSIAGVNVTDSSSITFTVDDDYGINVNPDYVRALDHATVGVTKLKDEDDTQLSDFWVAYHRSADAFGNYAFEHNVRIKVNAQDWTGLDMLQQSYFFGIETQAEHDNAEISSPTCSPVGSGDPGLIDDDYTYNSGIEIDGGELEGCKIIYNSTTDPVVPTFGPEDELPPLDVAGMDAFGPPINLQPPTVFTTPVKLIIPCPGHPDVSLLNIYLYNGTEWVLAYDKNSVQPGGDGWVVPGSRENDNSAIPPTVAIKMYHFRGVQLATSLAVEPSGGGGGGGGGCLISTTVY